MNVLILANNGMGLYKFRRELLQTLLDQNNEVHISLPYDDYVPLLENIGCHFVETFIDRRGTNPISDFKLLSHYIQAIKRIRPDVALTYTIKPNVYGGIACRLTNTPYISNITGLGTSIERESLVRKAILMLYKIALKEAQCVFFQNKSNRKFFIDNNIVRCTTKLIPGSGVNLLQHTFEAYPVDDKCIRLLFVGRMMKAKGLDELLRAAEIVKTRYPNVHFELVGGIEEDEYLKKLTQLHKSGVIKYYGQQENVHSFIQESHATILPSYHEGLANVLLESASAGRPVLASRIPGCLETFDEGVSGFGFDVGCTDSLVDTIVKFINLPHHQKREMGACGREKMERGFNRNIVIDAYIDELMKIRNRTDIPV